MKFKVMLLVAASMLFPGRAFCRQESVCELFSHLTDGADGREATLTGDLIISRDLAAIGAADCDNQYISNHSIWPTGLSLRPSPDITPERLQQFREAATKADNLRRAGKIVSASGSFSGRLRMVPYAGYPGELLFDSFESLSVEALPDPSTLPVTPICDLFQNLPAWKGSALPCVESLSARWKGLGFRVAAREGSSRMDIAGPIF
jgi:hypothetical protein